MTVGGGDSVGCEPQKKRKEEASKKETLTMERLKGELKSWKEGRILQQMGGGGKTEGLTGEAAGCIV